MNTLSTDIDQLLDKYKYVFSPELGTLKGIYANLTLKPNAEPNLDLCPMHCVMLLKEIWNV